MSKENHKDGEPDGLQEKYFENGQLEWKGNTKEGELDGPQERYYENGQLRSKYCYQNDDVVTMAYCEK